MKTKKTYLKPTLQVVEVNTHVALLQSSATLGGYEYQENNSEKGWQ